MNAAAEPFFSLIVPVHNGAATLRACLQAVHESTFRDWELIVVDDASSDGSGAVATALGARLARLERQSGPAAARNLGASLARGRYLFFLDADCRLQRQSLALAAARLRQDPGLDALFGSYDERPAAADFVSQYKNLAHHFVHQHSREDAGTFWAGCGAIRRERFAQLGGFDARRYPRPAVEDIELGLRLKQAGGRIRLAREVQVTHLKRWSLAGMVRSDLFDRAIPWAQLLWEARLPEARLHGAQEGWPADLNLGYGQRLSVLAVGGGLLAGLARRWGGVAFLAGLLLGLNRRFYAFLCRQRGAWFLLRALPLHWLSYLYSAAGFVAGGWGAWRHWRNQAGRNQAK